MLDVHILKRTNVFSVETHLTSTLAALDQLKTRLSNVQKYLTTPNPSPTLLRLTSSLASRWAIWDSGRLQGEKERLEGETLLVELLAAWTKEVSVLNDVVERFNSVAGDKASRRRFM